MSEREAAISRVSMDYFNTSIRPNYYECDQVQLEYFRFLDTLLHIGGFQDSIFNPVTTAEKANGIQEKSDITITFICRDSSTSEWKDAKYKFWLEKRTDWQVVKYEKIQ